MPILNTHACSGVLGMNMKLLFLLPLLVLSSCAKHHLATADKDYERMAYANATRNYEKALAQLEDRDAMLRTADAYQRQNMLERSADWYAKADQLAPLGGDDALRFGQVLMGLERTPDAIRQFDRVLAERPDDAMAMELWKATETRNTFYIDTTLFTVEPLHIPGMAGVFAATPYKGGLVFAGEKAASSQKENPWTGLSYLDLYSSKADITGNWTTPTPLPGSVNGRFHEGPATFSADGKVMYFTRSDYYKFRLNKDDNAVSHLKLFRAELLPDGQWGNIHQFAYNGEDHSTGHAALSSDGNTLYFISDRPGGLGGTDLYRCQRIGESWSEPENLGNTVNSPGNEMFPTLHGDTLYFSSNGHRTLGGLDIFRTWPVGDGWSEPENLNYPINTPHDDFALVMMSDGRSGFLSSNRSGSDRIHRFEVHDPTLKLVGTFRNEANGEPMADVEVKLLDLTTGEVLTLLTGPDGTYAFDLKKDHEYRVSGGKNGMFTESRDLHTMGQKISRTYREDFDLKEVVIEKPILVDNIYYDLDRWEIRPEAASELDKLARIFTDNPDLHFELSSHTDSRASDLYNLVLSEARAKSAVDYLIRKGVDPERITAKGYGKRRLVNHCRDGVECSEEEHQVNRRTEFKVTRMEGHNP
jgi:peptidoglycan-associated lipoprotein